MKVLALNCGSSSLKYQLFDWEQKKVIAVGIVERIGIGGSFIKHEVPSKDQEIKKETPIGNHEVAIQVVLDSLT
jgi:acetate kinase